MLALKGTNLEEVYKSFRGTERIKLRKKEYARISDQNLFSHFDPMLGIPPWVEGKQDVIIGKGLGTYTASTHLKNQDVKEGSIFLFFGGFQSTANKKISGHFIYGWLKVKKRIETYEECLEVITNSKRLHLMK